MKRWLILLMAGTSLTACIGTTAYEFPPPPDITEIPDQAERPIPLPERPEPLLAERNGEAIGIYDRDGLIALRAYFEVADNNTGLATDNAEQAEHAARSHADLSLAFERQAELAAMREDLLRQERSGRLIDGIYYKALLGLVLIGVAAMP